MLSVGPPVGWHKRGPLGRMWLTLSLAYSGRWFISPQARGLCFQHHSFHNSPSVGWWYIQTANCLDLRYIGIDRAKTDFGLDIRRTKNEPRQKMCLTLCYFAWTRSNILVDIRCTAVLLISDIIRKSLMWTSTPLLLICPQNFIVLNFPFLPTWCNYTFCQGLTFLHQTWLCCPRCFLKSPYYYVWQVEILLKNFSFVKNGKITCPIKIENIDDFIVLNYNSFGYVYDFIQSAMERNLIPNPKSIYDKFFWLIYMTCQTPFLLSTSLNTVEFCVFFASCESTSGPSGQARLLERVIILNYLWGFPLIIVVVEAILDVIWKKSLFLLFLIIVHDIFIVLTT